MEANAIQTSPAILIVNFVLEALKNMQMVPVSHVQ